MTQCVETYIFLVLVSLLFSAFFSGLEIAFLSANKLKLELQSQKGSYASGVISALTKRPSRFLTTILIGNSIALVVYGIYMALIINSGMDSVGFDTQTHSFLAFFIQIILSTLVVLIFAEFIPKALFRINPDKVLKATVLPYQFFYYLFYPIAKVVRGLSSTFLRVFFGVKTDQKSHFFNRYDLFHIIEESVSDEQNNTVDVDRQIFINALQFPAIKLRECMVPRTEVVAVSIDESVEEVRKRFADSGHSKIIVYRDSIDNIIGFIHLIDLFDHPDSIEPVLRPILISTESMPASELLRLFIEKRRSISVVVDEFGGTSGIVTIEDIIEEIFGEIEDEHDQDMLTEKQIDERTYIFSARIEVDYLNETYNFGLPEGDYETIGGLLLNEFQSIPEKGEVIQIGKFEFRILSVSRTRIDEIQFRILESENN